MNKRLVAVVLAVLAGGLLVWAIFGGGDSPKPMPAPKPTPTVTVPDTVHPQVFGCTSIEVAEDRTAYSAAGCYYVPSESKARFEGECGGKSYTVEGGTLIRIFSCETTLDPTCTEVQEFGPNGEYIPQKGPDGYFVELEGGKDCYYVANHLSAVVKNNACRLTEAPASAAPDGYRRYDLAC